MLTAERFAKIDVVRKALKHFVSRTDGCADPQCLVCGDNKRIAAEAFEALEQLEGEEAQDAHG